ncbi:MAG: OmpA family protein [Gammaproteobacteria bacterium]
MRSEHRSALALCLCLLLPATAGAQELRENLFADATAAYRAAREAQADRLSPRNYRSAIEAYQEAENRYDRGGNVERVRESLAEAEQYFGRAAQTAELAREALASLIDARDDAEIAGAPGFSAELWEDAEERFEVAAIELERGDRKLADRRAAEAEAVYRDAELLSIKANYLSDTRDLLRQADEQRVERYAPKTLAKAEALLAEAERAITEDRYDTDRPRGLAQEAQYEVRHAIYLAEYLRKAGNDDWTVEDVVLDWEQPLQRLAAGLDVRIELDEGYAPATDSLVADIEDLRAESQRLGQEVEQSRRRIVGLEDEIRELDARLGGASEERQELVQRLAAQARVREQFAQIEGMFERSEAQVFRQADDVYIRLSALSFDSGRATIDPGNFGLLTKLERAIQVFPDAHLVIEGHTDSYGGDAENFELSQRRAEAVRQYLLANARLDPARISSVGYGETRPVANNETADGRAKNRRIDVRIQPQLESA